jgi:hypothetical protein
MEKEINSWMKRVRMTMLRERRKFELSDRETMLRIEAEMHEVKTASSKYPTTIFVPATHQDWKNASIKKAFRIPAPQIERYFVLPARASARVARPPADCRAHDSAASAACLELGAMEGSDGGGQMGAIHILEWCTEMKSG